MKEQLNARVAQKLKKEVKAVHASTGIPIEALVEEGLQLLFGHQVSKDKIRLIRGAAKAYDEVDDIAA